MFALIETSNSLNLFKDDRIINQLKFKDTLHAKKIYESMIKGIIPAEVSDFLLDNEVKEIIVDRSLLKANKTSDLKRIVFKDDLKRLRFLKEKIKPDIKSIRGLSHKIAHQNVNFYTPDPLIIQSFALFKQVELDMEKYDKRAVEIYLNYLPELKIKKKRDEVYDDRTEFKESFDIEVIQRLWKIKEKKDIEKKLLWTRNSVGMTLSDQDWSNLQRIIDLFNLKKDNFEKLECYLKNKIEEHAPNLNELIGFRLTAEILTLCGSLINLAKCSSGTVQVLGAEKALFRSLKSKTPTPKYGILKNNGLTNSARIIRTLASKIVICARIDAFRNEKTNLYGKALREAIEKRISRNEQIDTVGILHSVSNVLDKNITEINSKADEKVETARNEAHHEKRNFNKSQKEKENVHNVKKIKKDKKRSESNQSGEKRKNDMKNESENVQSESEKKTKKNKKSKSESMKENKQN